MESLKTDPPIYHFSIAREEPADSFAAKVMAKRAKVKHTRIDGADPRPGWDFLH